MRQGLRAVILAQALLPAVLWSQIGNIVVTSAASFEPGGLPPNGSIATIFCTGLSVTGVITAQGLPLPTTLGGVTVSVNGVNTPLFAVADVGGYQQINFQVPLQSALGLTNNAVIVSQNGIHGSAAVGLSRSPGDFFRYGQTQFGIFQHASDYSLVTTDKPAVPGETLIGYLTGIPAASPSVPDGKAAPATPLSPVPQVNLGVAGPVDQIGLYVGTIHLFDPPPVRGDSTGMSPISFVGLSPGSVGLNQINFVLPADTPSGNVPVRVGWEVCHPRLIFAYCGSEQDPAYDNAANYLHSTPVLLPVR